LHKNPYGASVHHSDNAPYNVGENVVINGCSGFMALFTQWIYGTFYAMVFIKTFSSTWYFKSNTVIHTYTGKNHGKIPITFCIFPKLENLNWKILGNIQNCPEIFSLFFPV